MVCWASLTTPPTKLPPLPAVSVSVTEDSRVETDVPLVADVVAPAAVAPVVVVVSVVEDTACPNDSVRLGDATGADEVWLDWGEQPGAFTETQTDPVAETWPTGVSAPADTEVFVCAETGTGAETSAVSVAVVLVPVVARCV